MIIQISPATKTNWHGINYANFKKEHISNVSQNNLPAVSFNGIIHKNKLYSEFINEYKKQYPNIPIEEAIKNIILNSHESNFGKYKRVFNFPKMKDYVIGYFYKQSLDSIPQIHPCKIPLSKYYFGQPIATNDNNIIIMKKVNGVTSSVNQYYNAVQYISLNNATTKECSEEYLSKIKMFKDFPQSAYDRFAEQLIYINKNSDLVDYVNPNNLLIDTENKQFNLIDIMDSINAKKYYTTIFGSNKIAIRELIKQDIELGMYHSAPISFAMYSLLLDSKLQPYFLDKLNLEEQKEVIAISKDVIKKCQIALKNCGFNKNETSEKSKIVFNICKGVFGDTFPKRYQEFLDLYGLV